MIPPFNLQDWIEANRALLKPPVNNKNLYVESDDYIVMVVSGPNSRKDYHVNQTEELFYQLEGHITIYVQENGQRKQVDLSAGDLFLLPANMPHSPLRHKDSLGLVIERKRVGTSMKDGLVWHCEACNEKLHEVFFELKDIEKDFLSHFDHFYKSKSLRTCRKCGNYLEKD